MSNVLYVQNLEKQIAGQKQLIAEQNRLNKERQEWALHTSEVIRGLNQQLAEREKQVTLLRGSLLASANYIDALGGNSFDPRRILAATKEQNGAAHQKPVEEN